MGRTKNGLGDITCITLEGYVFTAFCLIKHMDMFTFRRIFWYCYSWCERKFL